MRILAPKILRVLINFFINYRLTYLVGMTFLRLSRKLRKRFHNSSEINKMVLVENCMGDIKMELDSTSYMGGSLYWSGYHHLNECLYLKSFLKSDMTFVDVGANQGEFSLFAANILTKGKVISFEPVSSNLKLLRKNVALNNFTQIEINAVGLFDSETTLPVYTSLDQNLNNGRHEGLSTLYQDEYRSVLEETIELKIFDDLYFEKLERFDFLKIDIEGAELPALRGMLKSISKFKPQILIEISSETIKNTGYKFEELIAFFDDLNYQAYSLYRGNLKKQDNLELTSWGNFVFI